MNPPKSLIALWCLWSALALAFAYTMDSTDSSDPSDPTDSSDPTDTTNDDSIDFDYYFSMNGSDFNATNCTNDYCVPDEDYIELMVDHIFPGLSEWVLIGLHSVVFVVGLVGNALVCMAVYRNHTMRTVTNYFIVNLAVADLMVILICLPPTVLWDVTETWFLGLRLCKAMPYLQTVSVSVSVLTLTFISIDRWYAICFPLRFKSTTGRAKTAIVVIWLVSLLVDIPDLLVLRTVPAGHIRIKTVIFTQCDASWSKISQATFTIVKFILLYAAPLSFMTVAYWQIVRVLWRSDIPGHNLSTRVCQMNETVAPAGGNPEGQLRSRRKAAKMLVAVVLTFALCYLPVHALNILRYTVRLSANQWINAMSLIAHWLCYVNSAVNPLIYNFMSGKFRKEFRRSFRCSRVTRGTYIAGVSNLPTGLRSRTATRSIQTTTNNNVIVQRTTEIIPLGAITKAR